MLRYWELLLLLVQLTLQKGGFRHHATGGRQRLLLLLCSQRHGPPGRGNTMALKDEQSPKYAFPGAGTSLLKSPRKSLLYVSRCRLLGAAAAGKETPCDSDCCCCCATKTRPSRTGKHHGPEGRTESKICVFRGRNCYTFLDAGYWELLLLLLTLQKGGFRQGNPMLLNGDSDCCCCCAHKDTAQAFPGVGTSLLKSPTKSLLYVSRGCTAAVALTAASACVCCCLLMPAAACCCLLLPAAACCLLLPAAPCCCARKDTALPDGETPWP